MRNKHVTCKVSTGRQNKIDLIQGTKTIKKLTTFFLKCRLFIKNKLKLLDMQPAGTTSPQPPPPLRLSQCYTWQRGCEEAAVRNEDLAILPVEFSPLDPPPQAPSPLDVSSLRWVAERRRDNTTWHAAKRVKETGQGSCVAAACLRRHLEGKGREAASDLAANNTEDWGKLEGKFGRGSRWNLARPAVSDGPKATCGG